MLNFKLYKSWTTGLVRFQVEFFKLELEIRLSSLQCLASGETFKMLEKNSLKLCGNCVLRTLQPRFNCSYFSGARLGPHNTALSTSKHVGPTLHSPHFIVDEMLRYCESSFLNKTVDTNFGETHVKTAQKKNSELLKICHIF